MAINKKINPDASPYNALEMLVAHKLCCDDPQPRDYSIVIDPNDEGNDTIRKIAIQGVIFEFSQTYSTTDQSQKEDIEDEIAGFLKTLGYNGRPTVSYDVDEFIIQISDSEAHFEWVGNYNTIIAFNPNIEDRYLTSFLNSDGVAVPPAGMTLTITEFTKNGETITDVQGQSATFIENGTYKSSVYNWLNTLVAKYGITFGYTISQTQVVYETGLGEVAGAPNNRIPFKLTITRSDDSTTHELEQTVVASLTYKENAAAQPVALSGLNNAW